MNWLESRSHVQTDQEERSLYLASTNLTEQNLASSEAYGLTPVEHLKQILNAVKCREKN